jgi:lysozyme
VKISENGIAFIKGFESCRLKAYRDSGGIWTVGFGSTGKDIGKETIWTQEQADDRFVKDLGVMETWVNKFVTVELTQNQFDALVDFTYNCGPGALQHSHLLKELNAGNKELAAAQFKRWATVHGRVVDGLMKRRIMERNLFLKY